MTRWSPAGEQWPTAAAHHTNQLCSFCSRLIGIAIYCISLNSTRSWSCDLADPYERVVANELVALAWSEDGENWQDEKLTGADGGSAAAFELPEPPPGELWTRDDFNLEEDGVLSLDYLPTKRIPKMEDVVGGRMFDTLREMMTERSVTDGGLDLVSLACQEFYFNADQAAVLVGMFSDTVSKIDILAKLQPRIVDLMNLTGTVYAHVTDAELLGLERKVGKLFFFTPQNPTGHYRLELANRYDRFIAKKLIEISSEEKHNRKSNELINTSQKGDWDNWYKGKQCYLRHLKSRR